MSRRFALPFRTALASDVELGAWHYELEPGVPIRVEGAIRGWDYLMNLRLLCEVIVHSQRLRATCGLAADSEIRVVVTVHSPQARYRAAHYRSNPLIADHAAESILCEIPGTNLAGDILIDTEVILTKSPGTRKPFLAYLPGSRLFTDRVVVELEGSSSRMPMEVAKFSEQLGWLAAPRAPWYVSCEVADLHAPVMKALRVYLNSEEPAFAEAARRADPFVVTLLGADVTRRILLAALNDHEFLR